MAQHKSPPPYTWILAPLGWWFQGPYRRKMAHLWPAGGLFHAVVFTFDGQSARGPFLTEDSAMAILAEELTPKPKAS